MRMRLARAAKPARPGFARANGRRLAAGGAGRKDRELLGQPFRITMRAGRPFPLRRANQDFAIPLAVLAMKFVEWHACSIAGDRRLTSERKGGPGDQVCKCSWSDMRPGDGREAR
jgi:hypothetical protein